MKFKFIFLVISFFVFFYSQLFAKSAWSCFFTTFAEISTPGLGYAITEQWDKAAILGGLRWYSREEALKSINSEFYQRNTDQVYVSTKSAREKTNLIISMNQETWNAEHYSRINFNTALISIWDLYEHSCERDPKKEVYKYSLAPFSFGKFYNNWKFWLPVGIRVLGYASFKGSYKIDWYTYRGLTKSQIQRDAFVQQSTTGMAEEMLFRGVIQKELFELYRDTFGISAKASRHLGIFSSALLFGSAHSGTGFSADKSTSFLYGLYQGYVYQPSTQEYDLTTAIAIHSWWNILAYFTIVNNADFHEEDGNAPAFPIFAINASF